MAFVGKVTGGGDGATAASNTSTFTLPAGAVAGNVCVVQTAASTGTQTVTTPPSGFTDLGGGPATNSGNTHRSYLYGKVLTSTDITTGSFSIVWSSSMRIITAGGVWDGVDTTTPFGAVANTIQTSGGTILLPAVTTTVANSQVLGLTTTRVTSGTASSATYPTDYTIGGFVATAYASGNNFGGSEANVTTPGAAGSYANENVTLGGTPVSSSAYSVVLNAPAGTSYTAGVSVSETATITTTASRNTTAAASVAETATINTTASRTTTGAASVSETVTITSAASKNTLAGSTLGVTASITTTASTVAGTHWTADVQLNVTVTPSSTATRSANAAAQVVTTATISTTASVSVNYGADASLSVGFATSSNAAQNFGADANLIVTFLPSDTEHTSGIMYQFTPPTWNYQELHGYKQDHLFGRLHYDQVGYTVLKKNGFYTQYVDPDSDLLDAADVVYLGGHVYQIDLAEYNALVAAGYGANVQVVSP